MIGTGNWSGQVSVGQNRGVPSKLGRKGLEQIIEVELTADEKAALQKSADAVLDPMKAVKI